MLSHYIKPEESRRIEQAEMQTDKQADKQAGKSGSPSQHSAKSRGPVAQQDIS
jgi:hypothetical protein